MSDTRLPLTISIFYHDVSTAGKAAALMNRLTSRFGSDMEAEILLWSFEVLRLGEVLDAAMRRTAEADLIVVSTPATEEIPTAVRDCLEGASMLRGNRGVAIVALLDQVAPDEPQPARDYLQGLCRSPEDSFFCTHETGIAQHEFTPDRIRQRANASSSVLDTIMYRTLPHEPRRTNRQ